MRIVSPLLKHVLYPTLSRARILRRPSDAGPAVLTYHGILPAGYTRRDAAIDGHLIGSDEFRAHLRFLKSRWNVIAPEQFRLWCDGQAKLPARSVLLTCDDGLLNTVTDMLPIIRDFDLPFLFFITGASTSEQAAMLWYERLYLWLAQVGTVSIRIPWRAQAYAGKNKQQRHSLWQELIGKLSSFEAGARESILDQMRIQIGISEGWEWEYSQNEPSRRRFFMLNRADLQKLADAGATIGAHTLSHPMLSRMSDDLAFHEISESRTQLENAIGREIWAFAYPFGTPKSASVRDAALARRAGFTCSFMNTENTRGGNFMLPRIHVGAGMGVTELQAHLSGLHRALQEKFVALSGRPVA